MVGAVALLVIIILLINLFPVIVIGAGERGVVFSNVSGVQDRVLDEGVHFRVPFVESIKSFDVRVQKHEVTAQAASRDLQTVTTKVVVNYHLEAGKVNKIYQSFPDADSIVDRVIIPNTSEVVKAATAQYTAENLLKQRAELKSKIDTGLSERLKSYNVVLDDVSIVDLDFSPVFNAAIEAKAAAEQEAQAQKNKLESVKYQAQQRVEQAQAEATAIKIQTEALSQNQNLIELKKAEALLESARKGVKIVPDTVIGNGTSTLFNLR